MAIQIITIGFYAQLIGDGETKVVTIDLTSGAATIVTPNGSLTKNFDVNSAVGITNVRASDPLNSLSVLGEFSSGKVTLTFATAPTAGDLVQVSGALVCNGS